MLSVSVPTLDRWRREHRQSGQVAPCPRGHKRCAFGTQESQLLQALLRQAPDATLEQHLQAWRAQSGQNASRASLARAIVRLGWTRKKERECQRAQSTSAPAVVARSVPTGRG